MLAHNHIVILSATFYTWLNFSEAEDLKKTKQCLENHSAEFPSCQSLYRTV